MAALCSGSNLALGYKFPSLTPVYTAAEVFEDLQARTVSYSNSSGAPMPEVSHARERTVVD